MKSTKNLGSSRVHSDLLQQNCFVRDVVRKVDLVSSKPLSSYVSLDAVTVSDGIKLVESDNPYPITPQYVDSFIESSDYRNDLTNAFKSVPSSRNLGDITDLQRASSMDTSQTIAYLEQLKSVLLANQNKSSDSSSSNNSSGEVSLNG